MHYGSKNPLCSCIKVRPNLLYIGFISRRVGGHASITVLLKSTIKPNSLQAYWNSKSDEIYIKSIITGFKVNHSW